MSGFKHHRYNNHRYNFYESHTETIETKSFYLIVRNILFFIALMLSLLVISFVSFNTYKKKKNTDTQSLRRNEINKSKFTQVISNTILKTIDKDNSLENVNSHQLKRIIKNVMEKVENSPNQIIYTQK